MQENNEKKEEKPEQEDNLNIEGSFEDVLKISVPKPKKKDSGGMGNG